jgi:cell wall assembly regulator SMI1
MDEWRVWKELLDGGDFDDSSSKPDGPIQTDWWNPKWIPLSYNGSGDHHCLDLDPAPGGQVGQIITVWHDWEHREVIASNFQAWLEQFADDLESGKYSVSEEYGGLVKLDE